MSILVLREGLFHRIKASKNTDLYALEIETPYIKSDLIRMEDNYGRRDHEYESLKMTKKITNNSTIFKIPKINKKKNYFLNGVKISFFYLKNFKYFKNFEDKSISIICDGEMINDKGRVVISAGEIVRSYTLKNLGEYFKINKKMLILKAKKI